MSDVDMLSQIDSEHLREKLNSVQLRIDDKNNEISSLHSTILSMESGLTAVGWMSEDSSDVYARAIARATLIDLGRICCICRPPISLSQYYKAKKEDGCGCSCH